MRQFGLLSFRDLPIVVKNIVIINVLMVLLQFVLGKYGIDLGTYLGLHYWKSPLFRWWQPLTHIFMHGSYDNLNLTFWHIFSNMLGLWAFGPLLEDIWGARRFLLFYLICGLGAAFCHLMVLAYEDNLFEMAFRAYQQTPTLDQYMLFIRQHNLDSNPPFLQLQQYWSNNPGSTMLANNSIHLIHEYDIIRLNEVTVGASGAVFGVLFAIGYLFPNALLYLYFLFPIKAKWLIGGMAVFELVSGLRSAGDNIAHFAHLGGMLFAFILLRIWGKTDRKNFY